LWVVAGTGTDVGKTWSACALAREVRARGLVVAARKPAQSFDPAAAGAGGGELDADLLARATGELPEQVCRPGRCYEVAMAPPMAAAALGRPPVRLADLVDELAWPPGTDVGLVEQAGGLGSPQAEDGDGVDMVAALRPDGVLLVSRPGLGALGDIGLARRALSATGAGTGRFVVLLNRFERSDPVQVANLRWLAAHGAQAFTTVSDVAAHLLGASPGGVAGGAAPEG
jgi:dethiobiotin synthetase